MAFIANHLVCFPTLMGGLAISNPHFKEPGTLGFIGTSNGTDRWLVSCYHVLCRPLATPTAPAVGESIVYHFDKRTPPPSLATTDPAKADKGLDAAAALIANPAAVDGRILGIAAIDPAPISAQAGMRVIKSGIATGVTEAVIRRADTTLRPTIEIESHDLTTDYEICSHGDSGALWLDAETLRPVGLHTGGVAGDETRMAIATPIAAVLARFGLRLPD